MMESEILRKCKYCGEEARIIKDLEIFAKGHERDRFGRRNICKKCRNKMQIEQRNKIRERGLCPICKKSMDRKGYACTDCTQRLNLLVQKYKMTRKVYRESRLKRAVCPSCGTPIGVLDIGKSLCSKCREKASRRSKILHWKYKILVVKMLGGRCINCGTNDLRLLTVHHKNGDGQLNDERGSHLYRNILSGERGIDDLEVRCLNCSILAEFEANRRWFPERFIDSMLDATPMNVDAGASRSQSIEESLDKRGRVEEK